MNDEELREALRPRDEIEPLDPAKVIAGARRRRKRGVVAGGAAAFAVLAVAAAGVLATNGTNPNVPVEPVSTPSKPSTTPRPPTVRAADVAACRTAFGGESPRPGARASVQASISAPDGTTFIVADSKYWAACDTGYPQTGVSARRPAAIAEPGTADPEPFAVAGNQITKSGKQYDYYWAAGVLPTGVKAIVYTFPDGSVEEAVIGGKYWLMHHWTPVSANAAAGRIKVRLLGANDVVLGDLRLEPGRHTCAQITHGC
jgi:hypothetical protein